MTSFCVVLVFAIFLQLFAIFLSNFGHPPLHTRKLKLLGRWLFRFIFVVINSSIKLSASNYMGSNHLICTFGHPLVPGNSDAHLCLPLSQVIGEQSLL